MKPALVENPKQQAFKKTLGGASDHYETPEPVFHLWDERYRFTIDVAATARNAKCKLYLTKDQDALSLPWGTHRCWMNPPYSRGELMRWTKKASEAAREGALVCGLLPAKTGTKWFHENIWQPNDAGFPMGMSWIPETEMLELNWQHLRISIHFRLGRLAFKGPFTTGGTGFADSIIVVWEPPDGYAWGKE